MTVISREVRRLREAAGLTQQEFGEALGMSPNGAQSRVSDWERGRTRPDPRTVKLMRMLYGKGD